MFVPSVASLKALVLKKEKHWYITQKILLKRTINNGETEHVEQRQDL